MDRAFLIGGLALNQQKKRHAAIVTMAGSGERFGFPKQRIQSGGLGVSLGVHSLLGFFASGLFDRVIAVVREEDRPLFEGELKSIFEGGLPQGLSFVMGGKTRSKSVWNGLIALEDLPLNETYVWVHDGARPGLSQSEIARFEKALVNGVEGLVPILSIPDTVKRIADSKVVGTENRKELFLVQTPQIFKGSVLFESYFRARKEGWEGSDETMVIDRYFDSKYETIAGSPRLMKVTTPEDLELLEFYLGKPAVSRQSPKTQKPSLRVGMGNDIHELVSGRKLILGGVNIDYPLGLKGHSDADALTHAVIDSLLGAAGLGDIGGHFPDTDPSFRGVESLGLLKEVLALVSKKGYAIQNIDAIVNCEKPKLATYLPEMKKNLAFALNLSEDQVNVKAKTSEGLGPVGEGKAIRAEAIAVLNVKEL